MSEPGVGAGGDWSQVLAKVEGRLNGPQTVAPREERPGEGGRLEAGLPGGKPSWTRGRAGEDRGRPHQLEQLAVRIEAPGLIAWWPAEVLNNGLADCYSHYRGGLHLPGSRPSAPRMPLLPRAARLSAAVCRPSPGAPAHPPGLSKLAPGPPWPRPRAGEGHGYEWPGVRQPGLGESFPLPRPLFSQVG